MNTDKLNTENTEDTKKNEYLISNTEYPMMIFLRALRELYGKINCSLLLVLPTPLNNGGSLIINRRGENDKS